MLERPHRRQLWNLPTSTTTTSPTHCTPFTLPSNGVITVAPTLILTLSSDVVFSPECTAAFSKDGDSTVTEMRDPFHASVVPQVFATGAATVIAWMLVIMLLITPRTFFVSGAIPRSGLLGRGGVISGATGGQSLIGVGSRPWLQKVAALTVAISLTIASADTFEVAERQYEEGYMDAMALRDEVVAGREIKISRIISDIFLWLALVQTLIRLFPRHKEKVIIKWTGFALIVCDITFSCLNSFMGNSVTRPRRFEDAIPALSYLFQLSLNMLYAAWVLYYSFTKRRYAFYHSMMWNISLVALLSIVAILTPVVFFITDISNYSVAGWGDYFRWVGAAAASVIVWEWVERIEALEREEKKDGILGREIFDGDEMLEVTPSEEVNWPRHRIDPGQGGYRPGGAYTSGTTNHMFASMARRLNQPRPNNETTILVPLGRAHTTSTDDKYHGPTSIMGNSSVVAPTPPQPVASPVSRSDTTSAASTIYAVRYHPIDEPIRPIIRSRQPSNGVSGDTVVVSPTSAVSSELGKPELQEESRPAPHIGKTNLRWQALTNPFKRHRATPPAEIRNASVVVTPLPETNRQQDEEKRPMYPTHNYGRWDIKGRLGVLAAEQGERLRERAAKSGNSSTKDLPVRVIPAQPRGRTWSPEHLMETGEAGSDTVTQAQEAETNTPEATGAHSITLDQSLSEPSSESRRPTPLRSDSGRSYEPPTISPMAPVSPISPIMSSRSPGPGGGPQPGTSGSVLGRAVSPETAVLSIPPSSSPPPPEYQNQRQGN